jgi:CRP-like cAMP-binding protein
MTLFRQGEPADALYLLVDGSIELRARPPGRRVYRTVELVHPTCTFGDEALFGGETYLMSARALEPARLLVLPRSSFERLSEHHPDIAVGILRCSGSCLLNTIRRSAILTQSPADVGLRQLLDELSQANGGGQARPVSLRITHAQLAGVLHLSRETVSRMLAQMANEGTVELGRGAIRVRQS